MSLLFGFMMFREAAIRYIQKVLVTQQEYRVSLTRFTQLYIDISMFIIPENKTFWLSSSLTYDKVCNTSWLPNILLLSKLWDSLLFRDVKVLWLKYYV